MDILITTLALAVIAATILYFPLSLLFYLWRGPERALRRTNKRKGLGKFKEWDDIY